jgi:hypothetical protein
MEKTLGAQCHHLMITDSLIIIRILIFGMYFSVLKNNIFIHYDFIYRLISPIMKQFIFIF